jgi:hypothetical protein
LKRSSAGSSFDRSLVALGDANGLNDDTAEETVSQPPRDNAITATAAKRVSAEKESSQRNLNILDMAL